MRPKHDSEAVRVVFEDAAARFRTLEAQKHPEQRAIKPIRGKTILALLSGPEPGEEAS
jgi:hypothetical protein